LNAKLEAGIPPIIGGFRGTAAKRFFAQNFKDKKEIQKFSSLSKFNEQVK